MNEVMFGDKNPSHRVTVDPNPHYYPHDDLLIREFIEGIEAVTTPTSTSFRMPRSAVEAVIRRLRSVF